MTPREGLTDVHIGRTRRIGTLSLVSFLISASAPMTVLAGGIVATFAVTGVVGVPVAFPIIALALGLFTVGYAAMSRHIYNAGAFYSYLAQGLGKVWAVSGAGPAVTIRASPGNPRRAHAPPASSAGRTWCAATARRRPCAPIRAASGSALRRR